MEFALTALGQVGSSIDERNGNLKAAHCIDLSPNVIVGTAFMSRQAKAVLRSRTEVLSHRHTVLRSPKEKSTPEG